MIVSADDLSFSVEERMDIVGGACLLRRAVRVGKSVPVLIEAELHLHVVRVVGALLLRNHVK